MVSVVDKKTSNDTQSQFKKIIKNDERSIWRFIRCMRCNHVVAHLDDQIKVMGSHLHKMTNPRGFTHLFACYSLAPGVVISGQAIAADSWFPGFSCRLAQCEECHKDMG